MSTRPVHPNEPDIGAHILVELMQRAGRSERDIVAAVREMTQGPEPRRPGIAARLRRVLLDR